MDAQFTRLVIRWFLAGALGGICFAVAVSSPNSAVGQQADLVVVLRGEKTVTLEGPRLRLIEIASALAKQTGRTYTLDKKFAVDKTEYSLLLRKVPLGQVLDTTSYLARAKWTRQGTRYHLRPATAAEIASDATQVGVVLDYLGDYLSDIPDDDKSLPIGIRSHLQDFRDAMEWQRTSFPPFPDVTMNDWQVRASNTGLNIGYQAQSQTDNGSNGKKQSRSWGWSNERKSIRKIGY